MPSRSACWARAIATIARTWLGVAGLRDPRRGAAGPGRGMTVAVGRAVAAGRGRVAVRRWMDGRRLVPGQLVVDRLVAGDVDVAYLLLEGVQVRLQQPRTSPSSMLQLAPTLEYSGRPSFFETPTLSRKGM